MILSPSTVESYRKCPRKVYHLTVKRDVERLPPKGQQAAGIKRHEELERHFSLGERFEPSTQLELDLIPRLRQMCHRGDYAGVEHRFAVDREFNRCAWESAWMRGVADLVVIKDNQVFIADWKTGLRSSSHSIAKWFYTAAAFAEWPATEKVTVWYAWLNLDKMQTHAWTREALPGLIDNIRFMTETIEAEPAEVEDRYEDWRPIATGLCKDWCPCTVAHCPLSPRPAL